MRVEKRGLTAPKWIAAVIYCTMLALMYRDAYRDRDYSSMCRSLRPRPAHRCHEHRAPWKSLLRWSPRPQRTTDPRTAAPVPAAPKRDRATHSYRPRQCDACGPNWKRPVDAANRGWLSQTARTAARWRNRKPRRLHFPRRSEQLLRRRSTRSPEIPVAVCNKKRYVQHAGCLTLASPFQRGRPRREGTAFRCCPVAGCSQPRTRARSAREASRRHRPGPRWIP